MTSRARLSSWYLLEREKPKWRFLGKGPRGQYNGSPSLTHSLMKLLRKLASQTVVYGLSSILGRFLNYLLVPLYTYVFAAEAYGVVSEFYAYAGFLQCFWGWDLRPDISDFARAQGLGSFRLWRGSLGIDSCEPDFSGIDHQLSGTSLRMASISRPSRVFGLV